MISKDAIQSVLSECKTAETNTSYPEIIDKIYNGKLVEVYVGDTYESLSTDQVSEDYPAVFCGIVEGASGNALILNCAYTDYQNNNTFGHYMVIHGFSIVLVKEVIGRTMEDLMDRSRETILVKKPD